MRILVLAAPCMHVGYLGCYGCDWVSTPHLDRLAAEGVVFDQHYADCPVRRRQFNDPSDVGPHQSWWTGRYWFPEPGIQTTPGAREAARFLPFLESQDISTLRIIALSRLEDSGPAASLLFPRRRLLEALARVTDRSRLLAWVDLPSLAPPWPELSRKHLRPYFSAGAEDERPRSPWLDPPCGMLNPMEVDALGRLQNTYAAALTYFDAQVGQLLKELRDRGWYDDLLLIVTADRGLALGEHGWIGESPGELHEELVHLPLLVRLPGGAEAGRRVAALTQPVDLYPTLLEALGVTTPAVHGGSLLPLARGEADEIRPYACAGTSADGAQQYLLRTPHWSFLLPMPAGIDVVARSPRLYVKPDDRWELNNVLQHHEELAQRLEPMMDEFVAATRQPGPLNAPRLPEEISRFA